MISQLSYALLAGPIPFVIATAQQSDTTRTKAWLMDADIALARAVQATGHATFLDAAAPNAPILIPGQPILRADQARSAIAGRYGAPASYQWKPVHAIVNTDGRFGCTMGFATYRATPKDSVARRGVYATCWERTSAGAWRVVAHQRNELNAPDTGAVWTVATPPRSATAAVAGDAKTATQNADADFAKLGAEAAGPRPAFARYIADDGILFAPPDFPTGPRGVERAFDGFPADKILVWEPSREFGAGGGGLAVTVGHAVRRARSGSTDGEVRSKYFTVWRQRSDGRWEYVLDFGSARP